jgi:hypothetical protein
MSWFGRGYTPRGDLTRKAVRSRINTVDFAGLTRKGSLKEA